MQIALGGDWMMLTSTKGSTKNKSGATPIDLEKQRERFQEAYEKSKPSFKKVVLPTIEAIAEQWELADNCWGEAIVCHEEHIIEGYSYKDFIATWLHDWMLMQ